jgi:hypothetical protein
LASRNGHRTDRVLLRNKSSIANTCIDTYCIDIAAGWRHAQGRGSKWSQNADSTAQHRRNGVRAAAFLSVTLLLAPVGSAPFQLDQGGVLHKTLPPPEIAAAAIASLTSDRAQHDHNTVLWVVAQEQVHICVYRLATCSIHALCCSNARRRALCLLTTHVLTPYAA